MKCNYCREEIKNKDHLELKEWSLDGVDKHDFAGYEVEEVSFFCDTGCLGLWCEENGI